MRSREGDLSVEGTFLGYDGAFYRLLTAYGEVSVDGARVTCRGADCPDPRAFTTRLAIAGSGIEGGAILPPLVETFAARSGYALSRADGTDGVIRYVMTRPARREPVLVLTLSFTTAEEGFADLVAGAADLVVAGREILPAEAALAREAGLGQLTAPGRSRILGLDALVPIVSVSNPLKEIALSDLRDVATGEIANWAPLTGRDAPIAFHLGPADAGIDTALVQALAPDREIMAHRHESARALADAVAADPSALGVAPFSALGNAQIVALRGPCGILSEAEIGTLKSEDYPLTAPIFLYSPARRLAPVARAFLDYASSPAAQAVVRRTGFVDQFPEAIEIEAQGDRFLNAILGSGDGVTLDDLRGMGTALVGRSRLSVSFRFRDGSSTLDAQSRSNVVLLSQAISRGVFAGRGLLFAGFSDAQGPAATNRRLALSRARTVRDAVERAVDASRGAPPRLDVAGFGEAMPMACDDVAWGRRVNRRVEVWLD